mmetsp:Transcript_7964/g.26669  ORF Transcript_7964/g.26669 Transcript_7964/m.26669 type:complete len:150 (-) Transcript_7964:379-828(-)
MGTLLFVLSFALLAVQASATLPISDVSSSKVTTAAIQKMSGRKMGELKAQAVNRMAKKHMLAEQGDDAKEVVGFGGMHYKRTKEEEEQAKQGPSFTDVCFLCLPSAISSCKPDLANSRNVCSMLRLCIPCRDHDNYSCLLFQLEGVLHL